MVAAYRRTYSPSRLAWSESPAVAWRYIHQIHRVNSRNNLCYYMTYHKHCHQLLLLLLSRSLLSPLKPCKKCTHYNTEAFQCKCRTSHRKDFVSQHRAAIEAVLPAIALSGTLNRQQSCCDQPCCTVILTCLTRHSIRFKATFHQCNVSLQRCYASGINCMN